MSKEKNQIIKTKIFPGYQQNAGEGQIDIPVWLKHCDKQTTEELRNLCGSYSQLSEKELEQQFPYFFWLPRNQEIYTEKPD